MSKTFKLALASMFVAAAFVATTVSASAPASSFPRNLGMGATGSDVKELQMFLNACPDTALAVAAGATGSAGNESMTYGPATMNAVMAYQAKVGVSAVGAFGPQTRAQAAAMGNVCGGVTPPPVTPAEALCPNGMTLASNCMTAPVVTPAQPLCPNGMTLASNCTVAPAGGVVTPPANNGQLMGGAGNLQDVNVLSSYSGEEVLEGKSDVKVMAIEVEADNGSDLAITTLRLSFEMTGAANSDKMKDFMDTVTIWKGTTEVGSADEGDFSEDSNVYTKSISLNGAIVKDGEKATLTVTVDANSSISSDNLSEDWTVTLESLRYQDAQGVVTTDDSTGEIGDSVDFTFEDLQSSGDVKIKLTEGSNSPAAQVVEVDDSSDTNGVLLLEVKLKAEGSDMTIDELEFDVTPTGANTNEMVSEYRLYVDGNEIDSLSATSIAAATTGQIVFTDLQDEFGIDADDTVTVQLKADIMELSGNFTSGDSILASLTGTNLGNAVIEDENEDDVNDLSGSVTGEAQTFYMDGISVALDSVDADSFTVDAVNNDRVELVIKFKVTAFGEDAYIPNLATATTGTGSTGAAPSTAQGVGFHVQSADAGLVAGTHVTYTLTSTADEEVSSFKVDEGSTETFTLKVIVTNDAGGALDSASARAILTGVNFADTDSATGDLVYTTDLQDTFKTGYATIAD